MHRSRVRLAATFVAGLVFVAGCGGGDDRSSTSPPGPAIDGEPDASEAPPPTDAPASGEVILMVVCDRATSDPAEVVAVDVASGTVIASAATALMDSRTSGEPFSAASCAVGNGYSADGGRVAGYQSFGLDHRQAGSIDLISGEIALVPSASSDPNQIGGLFVGDDLVYYDVGDGPERTVRRFDGSTSTDIGTCGDDVESTVAPEDAAIAAPYCLTGRTETSSVSPDGSRAVVGGLVVDASTGLAGRRLDVVGDADSCLPHDWIDQDTVLCEGGPLVGTFADGVLTVTDLAATSDEGVGRPVASPDGRQVAYVACDPDCTISTVPREGGAASVVSDELPQATEVDLIGWYDVVPGWLGAPGPAGAPQPTGSEATNEPDEPSSGSDAAPTVTVDDCEFQDAGLAGAPGSTYCTLLWAVTLSPGASGIGVSIDRADGDNWSSRATYNLGEDGADVADGLRAAGASEHEVEAFCRAIDDAETCSA